MARDETPKSKVVSQLAHPVYLDAEMLISFLASLEDGVSYSSEVAERYKASKDREAEAAGGISLPSIATLLGLTLSAEGRYKRRSSAEEDVESKFVREHTAASLFNRLRYRLTQIPDALIRIQSPDDLSTLSSGLLVEVQGEIAGNPLKQILDFLAALGPYYGLEIDEPASKVRPANRSASRSSKRSGPGKSPVPQLTSANDETADISLQDMLRILKHEVERSPIIDLLMDGPDGTKIVLTVSRELLTPEVEAYLIGGTFNVIGKASGVLDAGQSISLTRRTVFGFGGRQLADEMFGEFNKSMAKGDTLNLSLAQGVIDGPAIQILPLAIYL